jgi:hypothetical protein
VLSVIVSFIKIIQTFLVVIALLALNCSLDSVVICILLISLKMLMVERTFVNVYSLPPEGRLRVGVHPRIKHELYL